MRASASVRVAWRLARAHHPLCRHFRSDVFRRAGGPWCRGCVLTWPLFLLTLFAAPPLVLFTPLAPWQAVGVGFAMGVPQGMTFLRRFHAPARAYAKAVGGVGLGLVVGAGLLLPVPAAWKIAAAVGLLLAFAALLALRMRSILRTCDACVWRRDWGRCPGFTEPHAWREPSDGPAAQAPGR